MKNGRALYFLAKEDRADHHSDRKNTAWNFKETITKRRKLCWL